MAVPSDICSALIGNITDDWNKLLQREIRGTQRKGMIFLFNVLSIHGNFSIIIRIHPSFILMRSCVYLLSVQTFVLLDCEVV
jgi:hypothetical protein